MIGIKIFGSILILLSSTITGIFMAQKTKYRIQDLEEFKRGISFYKGSVNSMGATVSEAFKNASDKTKGAVKNVFDDAVNICQNKEAMSIGEIWKKAVNKNKHLLYFEKSDFETIYSFGLAAGFMDRQEQSENIDIIINEIDIIEKDIREKSNNESKMFSSMGVLAGLLLCIVLF